MEEEEVSEGPLLWRVEQPPRERVSETQAKDFERTFKAARRQLEALLKEYDDLRSQKERELKAAKELLGDHRTLEKERAAFDAEANLLAGEIPQVPKSNQKQAKEAAANTKLELYEIQLANRSIQELKQKRDALQSVFEQEKVIWKTERQRLLAAIDQLEVENETLRLTVEQTEAKSSSEDSDPPPPPPPAPKPVPAARPPKRQIQTALDRAIATESQAVRSPPRPQFQTDEIPFTDFRLAFDYWPSGAGTPSDDGREVKFANGEIVVIFKDGRKKLKRSDSNYVIFNNGDVQIDFDDGRVAYRYKQTMATEITLSDGTTHCLFRTGQREIRFLNGDKYIVFPDESTKYSKANGDYRITRKSGVIETSINGIIARSGNSSASFD
jgi:hypothetical protein